MFSQEEVMANRDLDPRGMDQGALYSFFGDVKEIANETKADVDTIKTVMHELLTKLDAMSAVRSAGDTSYASAMSGDIPAAIAAADLALTSLDPEG